MGSFKYISNRYRNTIHYETHKQTSQPLLLESRQSFGSRYLSHRGSNFLLSLPLADLRGVAEPEELRGQLSEPLRFDAGHLPHVFLRGQHKLVVYHKIWVPMLVVSRDLFLVSFLFFFFFERWEMDMI